METFGSLDGVLAHRIALWALPLAVRPTSRDPGGRASPRPDLEDEHPEPAPIPDPDPAPVPPTPPPPTPPTPVPGPPQPTPPVPPGPVPQVGSRAPS